MNRAARLIPMALVALIAVFLLARPASQAETAETPQKPGCADPAYDVYAGGGSFEGLKVSYAERRCEPAPAGVEAATASARVSGRNDNTTFLYGTCRPAGPERDPGGCAVPLEVQSAPSCERNPSRYRDVDGRLLRHRKLKVRGVPAAAYDRGRTLEVYTGHTTISVFGDDPARVLRMARAVVPVSAAGAPRLGGAGEASAARFTSQASASGAVKPRVLAKPSSATLRGGGCAG